MGPPRSEQRTQLAGDFENPFHFSASASWGAGGDDFAGVMNTSPLTPPPADPSSSPLAFCQHTPWEIDCSSICHSRVLRAGRRIRQSLLSSKSTDSSSNYIIEQVSIRTAVGAQGRVIQHWISRVTIGLMEGRVCRGHLFSSMPQLLALHPSCELMGATN